SHILHFVTSPTFGDPHIFIYIEHLITIPKDTPLSFIHSQKTLKFTVNSAYHLSKGDLP
ncbi:MAG: hypothetical protein ACI8V2_001796, partial [Candidatus Latescibacterota bacterium]